MPYASYNCFRVPPEVSDDQAVFVSDAAPTGWMGADLGGVKPGRLDELAREPAVARQEGGDWSAEPEVGFRFLEAAARHKAAGIDLSAPLLLLDVPLEVDVATGPGYDGAIAATCADSVMIAPADAGGFD